MRIQMSYQRKSVQIQLFPRAIAFDFFLIGSSLSGLGSEQFFAQMEYSPNLKLRPGKPVRSGKTGHFPRYAVKIVKAAELGHRFFSFIQPSGPVSKSIRHHQALL